MKFFFFKREMHGQLQILKMFFLVPTADCSTNHDVTDTQAIFWKSLIESGKMNPADHRPE